MDVVHVQHIIPYLEAEPQQFHTDKQPRELSLYYATTHTAITLTWHCMGDTSLRLAGLEIVANDSVPMPAPPLLPWRWWLCDDTDEDTDAPLLCPFEVVAAVADDDAKLPLLLYGTERSSGTENNKA